MKLVSVLMSRPPRYSWIGLPSLKRIRVGYPSIRYRSHKLRFWVQSTSAILTLPANLLLRSSHVGAKDRQWPHQGAKNLTNVRSPFCMRGLKSSFVKLILMTAWESAPETPPSAPAPLPDEEKSLEAIFRRKLKSC